MGQFPQAVNFYQRSLKIKSDEAPGWLALAIGGLPAGATLNPSILMGCVINHGSEEGLV